MSMSLDVDLSSFCSPFREMEVEIFVEATETDVQIAAAEVWADSKMYTLNIKHKSEVI